MLAYVNTHSTANLFRGLSPVSWHHTSGADRVKLSAGAEDGRSTEVAREARERRKKTTNDFVC